MQLNKNNIQAQDELQTTIPTQSLSAWLAYAALLLLAALAWLSVVLQGNSMTSTTGGNAAGDMTMAGGSGEWFTLAGVFNFEVSWAVMMAAMMLPSATPMLVMYGSVRRNFARSGQKGISTVAFTLVYLAVWVGLGLPVYAASQAIRVLVEGNSFLTDLLPYALALTLAAAGAYQFSPLKQTCLRACRSPMAFLIGNWRSGYTGTYRLAFKHALYCTGCCWVLMVVLVVAGAMALRWVLVIAALVLAEKLLPHGKWTARLVGVALLALGLLVALNPGLANVLRGQTGMGSDM